MLFWKTLARLFFVFGLVPMSTLVTMTLYILDCAPLDFGKCCMLIIDDRKAFEYDSFCLLTGCSGYPPSVSFVTKNHCSTQLES